MDDDGDGPYSPLARYQPSDTPSSVMMKPGRHMEIRGLFGSRPCSSGKGGKSEQEKNDDHDKQKRYAVRGR